MQYRVQHLASNIGQRSQRKPPLRKARMRYMKIRSLDNAVSVQQYVNIQRALPPNHPSLTPKAPFHIAYHLQYPLGSKRSLYTNSKIQKRRLILQPPGSRLIDG